MANTITFNNEEGLILVGNGAVGTPSYSFDGDQDTGMYSIGGGIIGFAIDGTERARINSLGIDTDRVYVTGGAQGTPSYTFTSDTDTGMYNGGTNILRFTTAGTYKFDIEADGTLHSGLSNYETLVTDDDDIPNKKYVDDAITTGSFTHPDPHLLGAGSVGAPTYSFSGDPDTGMYSTGANQIGFSTGGANVITLTTSGIQGNYGPNTDVFALNTSYLVTGNAVIAFAMPSFDSSGSNIDHIHWNDTANNFYFIGDAALQSTTSSNAHLITGVGTAGAPAYSFIGDENTGMYRYGTEQIGFAAGGSTRLTISNSWTTSINPFVGPLGSAAAPSYVFSGDGNTGMFSAGADTIGFTTGTTERLRISNSGRVLVAPATSSSYTTDGYVKIPVGGSTLGAIFTNTGSGSERIHWRLGYNDTVVGEIGTDDPNMFVRSAAAKTTTSVGGGLTIRSGDGGSTSGNGGAINITSGDGVGTLGLGGEILITAGSSYKNTGTKVEIKAGTSTGPNNNVGGPINLYAGDGINSASGGTARLHGGTGGPTGNGGTANIAGGQGDVGGIATITGGTGTSAGGLAQVQGGTATTGTGGDVQIDSGSGPTGGGDIRLRVGRDTTDGSNDGYVTIRKLSGTTSPELRLEEAGTNGTNYIGLRAPTSVTTNQTYTLPLVDGSNGDQLTTNGGGTMSWASASDERLKTEVRETKYGLEFINKLRPVDYKWKDDNDPKIHQGLVAQEVKELDEDFGGLRYSELDGIHRLNYNEFIAPLIKAIQELTEENKGLKQRLSYLESKII